MKMSKVALELKRREKSRIPNLIKKYDKPPRDFPFDPAGFRDYKRRRPIWSPQPRCTSCRHFERGRCLVRGKKIQEPKRERTCRDYGSRSL